MTLQEFLSLPKLHKVKKGLNGYTALCPAHKDEQPTLSIDEKADKIVLKCFAHCSVNEICAALDIELKDLFLKPYQAKQEGEKHTYKSFAAQKQTGNNQEKKVVKKETVCAYEYADESGELLYLIDRVHLTFDNGTTKKIFPQYRLGNSGERINGLNGTRRVPYRLPELIEAVSKDADVWLCEGEKDADNLRTLGLTATSFKNWKSEFNQYLKSSHVCLICDHDKAGLKQANDACKLLSGNVAPLRTLDFYAGEPLPEKHGKDFTDWFESEKQNGLSTDEIAEKLCILTDNAIVWQRGDASDADGADTEDFEETAGAVKVGCTFGELQGIELPERVEIVRGLGRGENGQLNAVSHTGKSTLIRNLVLNLVLGKPFEPLTAGGRRYRVAIIDAEDTLTFLRSDLNKMQADLPDAERKLIEENLFLICELSFGNEDLKLNKPEHFERVVDAINDFGADFVFIDTVTSAFDIRNENDNSEVIKYVMNPLKRFARLTNAGVLIAHHIGKAKLENGEIKEGVHRGRGASAFADKSRTIFNLDKDGGDQVILSCPKLKGERFPDTIFKYDRSRRLFERKGETCIVTNYEILLDAFENDKGYKRKDIDEILEGEMSKATITRSLKTAIERGDLTRQKGVYTKNAQMLTPYSNEHLSISDNSNNHNDLQTQENLSETEICPTCERGLDETANGHKFCEVCLYTKPL